MERIRGGDEDVATPFNAGQWGRVYKLYISAPEAFGWAKM
jgi:hypothetical protein